MSETLPELRPCPFCGSKNVAVLDSPIIKYRAGSRDCAALGAWKKTDVDAIDAWNTRTADKLIERLRKALEFYARFFRLERDILSWPDTVQKWRWTGDTAEETGGPIVAREALDAEKTNTTND